MKGRQLAWIFGTFLALTLTASAATEFVCSIQETLGAGDYTNLATWNAANYCQLSSTGTLTAAWNNQVGGIIPDGKTVYWDNGGGTGLLKHATTVAKSGSNMFLIGGWKGSTLDLGDVVTFGTNPALTNFTVASVPDTAIAVARIEGTWQNPDCAVTISGWNQTTPTNYIKIYTTGQARHKGKWTTTAHRIENYPGTYAVQSKQGCVRLDGLQIRCRGTNGATANANGIYIGGFGGSPSEPAINDIRISNCIIWGDLTNCSTTMNNPWAISGNHNALNTDVVWNTVIYGFRGTNMLGGTGSSGGGIFENNSKVIPFNCVIADCTAATYNVTLAYNCAYFNNNITNNPISYPTNCASDAKYAGIVVTFTNRASDWANVFVDATNADGALRDYHLKNYTGPRSIIGMGTNIVPAVYYPYLSSYKVTFTDDIDGEPRGSLWDIGADQYVNTAPPVGTIITFR